MNKRELLAMAERLRSIAENIEDAKPNNARALREEIHILETKAEEMPD
jgi:hypothetical protein